MKEIKIPETITTQLFVAVDVKPDAYSFGQVRIDCFDLASVYKDGDEHHKYIKLHEIEVTVEIPPCEIDLTTLALVYLQEKRQKELAEHHMKLKNIDDQILELRTLEYHPQEAA